AARGTPDPYGLFLAALPRGAYSVLTAAEGRSPHRRTVEIHAGLAPAPARVQLVPARRLELPAAGTWLFDPPHTAIRFIAQHVGMAHVHGRFTRRSEEHTSELQSRENLVCRPLLEKKKNS